MADPTLRFSIRPTITVELGDERFEMRPSQSISMTSRLRMAKVVKKLAEFGQRTDQYITQAQKGKGGDLTDEDLDRMEEEIRGMLQMVAAEIFVPYDERAQRVFESLGFGQQQDLILTLFQTRGAETGNGQTKKGGRSSRASRGSTVASRKRG